MHKLFFHAKINFWIMQFESFSMSKIFLTTTWYD